ncbi:F-box/kelch-repeat protein At3g06240-like [Cornus florida]|uniref:F-box/kelch-repeat protein At3g06240-like n=1 Tax=Cornus florida TaxID=4283 RepID=UPI0028988234|nr:F-box/kelch-repeat protein At3g06240-like [Cornus florida]
MAWLRRFLLRLHYFCLGEEKDSIKGEEESNRQSNEESIREEKEESRQSNEESIRGEEESKREEKEESIQSNEESVREEKESIKESRQSNKLKAKEITTTLMPYIPHQLLVEILLKLPMNSLIRFKCVSKSWLSLISHSYFTRTHLNQSKSITKRILIVNFCPSSVVYTVDLGSTHNEVIVAENIDNIIFDIMPHHHHPHIIGSCNGLVCIGFLYGSSYVIFNPYTKESKRIPYCNLLPCCPSLVCGFGYDRLSDDYKLVKLGKQSVYIYSLRAGSWKKVQDYVENSFYVEYSCYSTRGMLLNGAIHWFCLDINSNRKSKIAAFDLVGEKLSEIPLPSFFTNVHKMCRIGVFGGCLCVKVPYSDEFWVMKEYRVEQSWTKVHVEFPLSRYAKSLAFLNNDETLITTLLTNLVLYNTRERSYRNFVLPSLPHDSICEVVVYAESLVSPVNSFC